MKKCLLILLTLAPFIMLSGQTFTPGMDVEQVNTAFKQDSTLASVTLQQGDDVWYQLEYHRTENYCTPFVVYLRMIEEDTCWRIGEVQELVLNKCTAETMVRLEHLQKTWKASILMEKDECYQSYHTLSYASQ